MSRSVTVAAVLALVTWSAAVFAKPPAYCAAFAQPRRMVRGLGPAGQVLVTTRSAEDEVALDGIVIGHGPLLVGFVRAGEHIVSVRPVLGSTFTRRVDVLPDAVRIVGPAGTGLSRAQAPRLSVTWLGSFDVVDNWVPDGPPMPPRVMDAAELARRRCDPALAPHLPATSSLLLPTEAACARGDAGACRQAGDDWASDVGPRAKDPRRAAARYEQACLLGDLEACGAFAQCLERGEGVPADAKAAAFVNEKACAGGYAASCRRLGRTHLGDGADDQARARALPYLSRACDGGDFVGCALLREAQLGASCRRGDFEACALLPENHPLRVAPRGPLAP